MEDGTNTTSGFGGLSRGYVSVEVGLVGVEGGLTDDLALERLHEVVSKTGRVVVAVLIYHVSLLAALGGVSVVRHDGALERIEEAYAEIEIISESNLRVGAGASDSRNARTLKRSACRDRNAGAVRAEDSDDAGSYQLGRSGDGSGLIRLVGRPQRARSYIPCRR